MDKALQNFMQLFTANVGYSVNGFIGSLCRPHHKGGRFAIRAALNCKNISKQESYLFSFVGQFTN